MAAIRNLGIVVCSYKITHEASVVGHINDQLVKFYVNPMHSFEDMGI